MPPAAQPLTLPPLNATALVITKANLIDILHLWMPAAWDISQLGDDRFVLEVGPVDLARVRR